MKSRLWRNEILGLQSSDEIVRFARDEIKSVLQPDEVGFHHEAISSTEGGFHPSARTDLVEKSTLSRAFFWLPLLGSNQRHRD